MKFLPRFIVHFYFLMDILVTQTVQRYGEYELLIMYRISDEINEIHFECNLYD